ncbi:MAG: hypothetical protein ACRCV0_04710, partial [Brevinema sp.]
YLFNPKLSTDELKDIITKMNISYNKNGENKTVYGEYDKLSDIKHTSLCIDTSRFMQQFEDDPAVKDKYLKGIGYAELNSISWEDAPTVLREAQEKYHFGLLASPKDNLNYQNKTKVRSILHSSDAHQYSSDLENTNPKDMGHCFTWIKGEPSFEGLKYALEDPNSRIKIQEKSPFFEKTPPYIEKIIFPQPVDFTDSKKNKRNITITQTLYFNRYMNSIIGGRGSGKTTLLEVVKSISDSHKDCIFMKEGNEDSQRKEILYIPKDSIDNDNFSIEKYLSITNLEFSNKLSITDSEIFKIALSNNIEQLKQQLSESETKITNYSSEQMQTLIEEYNNTTKEIGEFNSLKTALEKLTSFFEPIDSINQAIVSVNKNSKLNNEIPRIDVTTILENIKNNKGKIDTQIKTLNDTLLTQKTELEKEFPDKNIQSITDAIQAEQAKIKQFNNEIIKIEKTKEQYKNLQDSIPQFVNEYKEKLEQYITDIKDKWGSKKQNHNHKELLENLKIDVKLTLDLDYFTNRVLSDFLNNKNHSYDSIIQDLFGSKDSSEIKKYCDINKKSWSITDSLDSTIIQDFFDMLSRKEGFGDILNFVFKSNTKGGDEWNVKTRMLHYIYSFSYIQTKIQLLYKDKPFEVLSAGEKGVISLLINIDIGEADIPLLIDQPEDYLDNNFIHNELIPILQEIKKNRQVIMVSHNPNLVVNGDSELVFVAKNISDQSGGFDYISGSLESNELINTNNFSENESMKQRICSIIEGGELAFKNRSKKYGIKE